MKTKKTTRKKNTHIQLSPALVLNFCHVPMTQKIKAKGGKINFHGFFLL